VTGRKKPGPRRKPVDPELRLDSGLVIPILVDFLKEETRRVGYGRLVIGLSGGIDSAVSAALASRALGPKNVLALFMPYRTSDPQSLVDGKRVADFLGLRSQTIDITPMIDAYFQGRPSDGRRRGNKMARERMSILFDASESFSGLVIGTSNKTELLLGYGTIHGDLASAINPLGDLYKTQVRQIAKALDIPGPVIKKAPSADLVPGQTDEEDLGSSYELLDAVLVRLVDRRLSSRTVRAQGWPPDVVSFVCGRLRSQQFKRRPPLIAKISTRTIGPDFRYARDWGT